MSAPTIHLKSNNELMSFCGTITPDLHIRHCIQDPSKLSAEHQSILPWVSIAEKIVSIGCLEKAYLNSEIPTPTNNAITSAYSSTDISTFVPVKRIRSDLRVHWPSQLVQYRK